MGGVDAGFMKGRKCGTRASKVTIRANQGHKIGLTNAERATIISLT